MLSPLIVNQATSRSEGVSPHCANRSSSSAAKAPDTCRSWLSTTRLRRMVRASSTAPSSDPEHQPDARADLDQLAGLPGQRLAARPTMPATMSQTKNSEQSTWTPTTRTRASHGSAAGAVRTH